MSTEPPAGGGRHPSAGGYPPPRPDGGQQPAPGPFPASYPPPQPGQPQPGQPPPGQPQPGHYGPPAAYPAPAGYPAPTPPAPLPDPPPGRGFDAPLPEPPTGMQPALQWGDPTPAPAPPPRPGPPPPLSRLAVAAAAAGALVGGAGLGLILGIVAWLRVRRSGKRGAGLALLGIGLTIAWAVAGTVVWFAVLSKPPLRDANGVVTRKGEVDVDRLHIGDCLENWTATVSIGSVVVVPCTTPHNAEVFHTFGLEGKDKEYPGDGIIRTQAQTQCLDKSKSAVKPEDLKNAKVALLKPIAASWVKGERQVTCLTVQNSGTIARSIRT